MERTGWGGRDSSDHDATGQRPQGNSGAKNFQSEECCAEGKCHGLCYIILLSCQGDDPVNSVTSAIPPCSVIGRGLLTIGDESKDFLQLEVSSDTPHSRTSCPLSIGNVNCATPSATHNFEKGDPKWSYSCVYVYKWWSQSLLSKGGPFESKRSSY